MAPLLKLTLSFSLLASTAFAAHSPKDAPRNHLKMVKRTMHEENGKRQADKGPYGFGYDRCGIPRTKKYVKKTGASPVPSAKWKPCPTNASATGPNGAQLAVPTGTYSYANGGTGGSSESASASAAPSGYWDDEEEDTSDDFYVDPSADPSTSWDAAGAAPTESYVGSGSGNGNGQGLAAAQNKKVAAPTSSYSASGEVNWSDVVNPSVSSSNAEGGVSTVYTTQIADTTIYTTYTPEASPTSSWSEEAGSSSSAASEESATSQSREFRAAFGKPGGNPSSTETYSEAASSSSWVEPSSSSAAATSEAPATTPVYTGSNAGKLGLAWDWLNPSGSISQWDKASKVYTWSAFPPPNLPSNIEFLPQYWGPSKEGDFTSQVANGAIKPGMTILGFNEPDQVGQANMAVADGVREYKRLVTPYASQGYKLATPGCTSDDNGFNWIKSFIEQCGGSCGFSILQTHYYGTDPDEFIAYIQKLRQFGLPIIVSEFAAETFGSGVDATDAQVSAFLSKTQSWLNGQNDVLAYMFFGTVTKGQANGVSPANLMFANDATGEPNTLGWQYLNGA